MEAMLKLTDEQYDNLFVTSDLHFGHQREFLYTERGFSSPLEMNESIIETINDVVGSNGILLTLGDFCLNTTIEEYVDILNKIKIKEIWMLLGNHNNPHYKNYNSYQDIPHKFAIENKETNINGTIIKRMGHYLTMRKGSKAFVCFHFPIMDFDSQNAGSMMLCGHSHYNLDYTRIDNKTAKILDCGWDGHKKPLHIKEIVNIMQTKDINPMHHFKHEQ